MRSVWLSDARSPKEEFDLRNFQHKCAKWFYLCFVRYSHQRVLEADGGSSLTPTISSHHYPLETNHPAVRVAHHKRTGLLDIPIDSTRLPYLGVAGRRL